MNPHAEFAEFESHAESAESAESAEPEFHAESAEFAEIKSHAKSAENAESESHAEFAESAEISSLPPSERGVARSAGGSTPSGAVHEQAVVMPRTESPPSQWSFRPDTTPKERGVGCLTITIAYYVLGLLIWQGENWKGDASVVRGYILAPFAWPVAIASFIPQKALALRIGTALACIAAYGWLLRDFIAAKTRGILWRSAILLGLLFLLSFCGCWSEFGQEMEGIC